MNIKNLKFKTRGKIARARDLARLLPPDQARIISDLCTAHAAMAETNARLWRDNAALRAAQKQEAAE